MVIEWNGRSLHDKSAQDVYDIVAESRQEPQIELIVSRPLNINRRTAQAPWRQSHSPTRVQVHHRGIFSNRKPNEKLLLIIVYHF